MTASIASLFISFHNFWRDPLVHHFSLATRFTNTNTMTTQGCIPMNLSLLLRNVFGPSLHKKDLVSSSSADVTDDESGHITDSSSSSRGPAEGRLVPLKDGTSRQQRDNGDDNDDASSVALSDTFLDQMELGRETSETGLVCPEITDAREVSRKHFTGALDGSQVLSRVVKVIEARGYTPENTLYGQSVCPDEINHEEGDITNIFTEYMGEVFHLGGLAGLPFSGRTGFSAFTHHVPNGGHCFVLMAPHIGISENFHLGKYTRDGQGHTEGAACGAAVGALAHCEACKRLPRGAHSDMLDYQMNFIIRKVNEHKKRILENCTNHDEKMRALVHEIWKIGKDMMLDEIVHAHFGDENSKLLVLTGIQINMPRPHEDMFQPLSFVELSKPKQADSGKKSWRKKSKKNVEANFPLNSVRKDLFEETFGHEAPVLP